MRLDHADDDDLTLVLPSARLLEHLVGLADAGGRAEKDLEPPGAALLLARLGEQGIGRRALVEFTPLIRHTGPVLTRGLVLPAIAKRRLCPKQDLAQAR